MTATREISNTNVNIIVSSISLGFPQKAFNNRNRVDGPFHADTSNADRLDYRLGNGHLLRICHQGCSEKLIPSVKQIYGYPIMNEEMEKKFESGQYCLGGCCIDEHGPTWKCICCDTPFYKIDGYHFFFEC